MKSLHFSPSISRTVSGKRVHAAPVRASSERASFEQSVDRRALLLGTTALTLLPSVVPSPALAIERPTLSATGTKVFLEIKVDNEIFGKVIIELFGDVTIGAQRFLELSKGLEGVQYRSSKFEEINAGSYIVNGGLRNLTYSAGGETKVTGGDSASEQLVPEFEKKLHKHDSAGIVSLYVFDNEEREIKERLIARDGKLVTIQEDTVPAPNGTSFTITLKPLPELDETNLPVGRVVSGLDIVERVSKLKAVADNSDSPYFKVAKAIGDKRAITAERGFSRPFARVVVSKCGIVN